MTLTSFPGSSPGIGATVADREAALSRNGRWLRAVLSAQLRESHAVEDVLQEVALAAVAQGSFPREAEGWAPWLYRTAVRQALLYRRKLGRERRRVERYAARVASAHVPSCAVYDPLDLLLTEEQRTRIRTAMSRLHRKDAEVLLLKYIEGWSCAELGLHLGATRSAIEARLHRARTRLRSELARLQVIEARP